MKHARVMHQGRTHNATERDGQLLLDNGALVPQDSVTWLPPLPPTARPPPHPRSKPSTPPRWPS